MVLPTAGHRMLADCSVPWKERRCVVLAMEVQVGLTSQGKILNVLDSDVINIKWKKYYNLNIAPQYITPCTARLLTRTRTFSTDKIELFDSNPFTTNHFLFPVTVKCAKTG